MTAGAPADETVAAPTDTPGPAPEFQGETPDRHGDGSIQIAYLHGGQVSHSWHQSLMNAVAYDKSIGVDVINHAPFAVSCSGPNSLVEGRNIAVQHFLDKTDASWLMFIDTDMGFEADAIQRLLFAADPEKHRMVVGGLCFALKHVAPDGKGGFRVMPVPTLFMWAKNPKQGYGFANRFKYPPDGLVKVDGTGAAFLLIHRRVLAEVRDIYGDTWFNLIQYDDGTVVSEDLSLCYRIRSVNRELYVHTGVRVSHHKQMWLDEGDYQQPESEPMRLQMEAANDSSAWEVPGTEPGTGVPSAAH